MNPIVRNIKTDDLYEWDGEKFTNLRTLKSGIVSDEAAQKTFSMNVEASEIIHEFPIVKELISRFNLKFTKDVVGV